MLAVLLALMRYEKQPNRTAKIKAPRPPRKTGAAPGRVLTPPRGARYQGATAPPRS